MYKEREAGTVLKTYAKFYTPSTKSNDGECTVYGLYGEEDGVKTLFYVGQAHGRAYDRVALHLGERVPYHSELPSPTRVRDRVESIRKRGGCVRAVTITKCRAADVDREEMRAIGWGQALDGLINHHCGGRQVPNEEWADARGLLPCGDHELTLSRLYLDRREQVTFIYEAGAYVFYNKIPLLAPGSKWHATNVQRIIENMSLIVGRPVTYEEAIAIARDGKVRPSPCTVRVTDFAANYAGQSYKRYDVIAFHTHSTYRNDTTRDALRS